MKNLKNLVLALWKDESGQDMAEYALLLVLIAIVVAAGALVVFGGAIGTAFNNASEALENGTAP